ncbi:hypothetical protein FDECE_16112 [Fusarium decemcellulare]|nr:hypothetical protein FDECE_16112 [Fusarium decemcellulare]
MQNSAYPLGLSQGPDDLNCYPTLLQAPWSPPHDRYIGGVQGNSDMSVPVLPITEYQPEIPQPPIDDVFGPTALNQCLHTIPATTIPQATTTASHLQLVTPSFPTSHSQVRLAPTPPDIVMFQPGVSLPSEPSSSLQLSAVPQDNEKPAYFTGSHAFGQLAGPTTGIGTENTIFPAEEMDNQCRCWRCCIYFTDSEGMKCRLMQLDLCKFSAVCGHGVRTGFFPTILIKHPQQCSGP